MLSADAGIARSNWGPTTVGSHKILDGPDPHAYTPYGRLPVVTTAPEIELPAEEFALWATFTEIPNVEFDAERIVAHERDRVMPVLWIGGAKSEEITAALDGDPSIEDERMLVDLGDRWLYQMTWVDGIEAVIRSLVHEEGTITAVHGRNDRWNLRIVFPEHDALSRTYQDCREEGLTTGIKSVTEMDDEPAAQFGLSNAQYRTLVTAYKQGYFRVLRETIVEELADELGVPSQSVSERLRRGHERLIGGALPVEVEEADFDA